MILANTTESVDSHPNLTLSNLWAKTADDKLRFDFILLFLLQNGVCHFMRIVSYGDNSHKMSNTVL